MSSGKKVVGVIMFLTLITVSLGLCNEPQIPGFVPKWKVGDKWFCEASYKDLKTPGEPWLPPITWVFHVRSIKQIHRQPCYVLHIFPQKQDIKVQAILYLSAIDLRPMKIIDIFPTPTGVKHKERVFDPFQPEPILSQDSLVPYDLPVFPLVRKSVQNLDGFDAYRSTGVKKEFKKISKVGGLSFKKSITQTGKAPEKHYADSFSSYRGGGELFQVELFDSSLKETTVQIWQEGSPWALTSENSSRKVRLIPAVSVRTPQENEGGNR